MTVTSRRIIWLIGSATSYLVISYGLPRQRFDLLIGLVAGLFIGYGWLLKPLIYRPNHLNVPVFSAKVNDSSRWTGAITTDRFLFGSALLFRLLLLLAQPNLSDDVYRFVWDGRLLAHGFNPYLYLPGTILNTDIGISAGLDEVLFRQLNSPHYFTVYPPLNQALFGLAARLSGGNFMWNIVWLRLPIVLSEIGTLWLMVKLLHHLGRNPNLALLYGLNPLVILELTGNLHAEAVMIFFTLLAFWLLARNQLTASAGVLALAIGTKLLPLILLPLVLRYLPWQRATRFVLVTSGVVMALFAPFASAELAHNLFSSINLYFQKFEFNASVYYVLRAMSLWISGRNPAGIVGVGLAVTTTLSMLWITFRWPNISLAVQVLAMLTIYFAFATTVHPWYVTSLVAVSAFTRFRYPVVWSSLIFLSYYTYRTQPYHENLWLTAVEYGIVGAVALGESFTYRGNNDTTDRPTADS